MYSFPKQHEDRKEREVLKFARLIDYYEQLELSFWITDYFEAPERINQLKIKDYIKNMILFWMKKDSNCLEQLKQVRRCKEIPVANYEEINQNGGN